MFILIFSAEALCRVFSSLCHVGEIAYIYVFIFYIRSDDFLGKCVDRAEVLCDDFLPKSVGVMAWSLAVLHYPVPTLLSRFSHLALDQIDEYSVQAISNLLWSGAVFRTLNEKLTGTVFAKLNRVLNDIGARACPKRPLPLQPFFIKISMQYIACLSLETSLCLRYIRYASLGRNLRCAVLCDRVL